MCTMPIDGTSMNDNTMNIKGKKEREGERMEERMVMYTTHFGYSPQRRDHWVTKHRERDTSVSVVALWLHVCTQLDNTQFGIIDDDDELSFPFSPLKWPCPLVTGVPNQWYIGMAVIVGRRGTQSICVYLSFYVFVCMHWLTHWLLSE